MEVTCSEVTYITLPGSRLGSMTKIANMISHQLGPFESIPSAEPDTIWVNNSPVYKTWRSDPKLRILWITGPPGCGKSVLARHLVEKDLRSEPGVKLCYYFSRPDPKGKQTSIDWARPAATSVISQLHQAGLNAEGLLQCFNKALGGSKSILQLPGYTTGSTDRNPDLKVRSGDAAAGSRPVVTCVLDGIDEVAEDELSKFLGVMMEADHGFHFKLLITCRPIFPKLQAEFHDTSLVLQLEHHKKEFDECVRNYVSRRLSEDSGRTRSSLKPDVWDEVFGGSFLVADANLSATGSFVGALGRRHHTVDIMPWSLREKYDSALGDSRNLNMDILQIMAVATRPLTVRELLHTVGDGKDTTTAEQFIRDRCQGLITGDDETGLLLIPGFKVLDYVRVSCTLLTGDRADDELHRRMLLRCLEYISASNGVGEMAISPYPEVESEERHWKKNRPFLEYAATNWSNHATKLAFPNFKTARIGQREGASICNKVLSFCNPESPQFKTWFPLYWKAKSPSKPLKDGDLNCITDLMVASYIGLEQLVEELLLPPLVHGPQIVQDAFDKMLKANLDGQIALHIAIEYRHGPAAKAHMDSLSGWTEDPKDPLRAKVINRKDHYGQTPLHYAVKYQVPDVVGLLLTATVNVNLQDDGGKTALHYAAEAADKDAVEKLLEANAYCDIEDVNHRTPRQCAEASLRTEDGMFMDRRTAVLSLLKKAEIAGSGLADEPNKDRKDVAERFHIEGVAFPTNSPRDECRQTVWDFLSGGGRQWLNKNQDSIRWLHLPANNMIWVELLIKEVVLSDTASLNSGSRDEILRKDAWTDCQHRGSPGYYHATFMEPQCRPIAVGRKANGSNTCEETNEGAKERTNGETNDPFHLYMPYIHWERLQDLLGVADFINKIKSHEEMDDETLGSRSKNELLLFSYLNCDNPLHIRRTLDQYRYHNLEDTRDRDQDQLFCRVFLGSDTDPPPDPPMLMVDQLWLWMLPGGTIITSFPARWGQSDLESGAAEDREYGRTDILSNIKRKICEVGSPSDLIGLIIGECLSTGFGTARRRDGFPNIFDTYSDAMGKITDSEARLFKAFSQGAKSLTNSTPRNKAVDIVDPVKDMGLLREIKDIIDELKTMSQIFHAQSEALMHLPKELDCHMEGLRTMVSSRAVKTEKMINQAEMTAQALNDLIDLKQKFSNVLEARWARNMAEETSRQGNTLLVFTIVTIIFLPLSFMAAFFALNIAQFPKTEAGLDLGFVSKYIFSISAAVTIPLLLIAFNVNSVTQFQDMVKASIIDRTELKAKKTHPSSEVDKSGNMPLSRKGTMRQRLKGLRDAAKEAEEADDSIKPRLPITSLLLYIFVILLVGEVLFACQVLLRGANKLNLISHDRRGLETMIEEKGKWKLRPSIRRPVSVVIGVLRIAFVPLWLSILCVEFLVGAAVYGLLCLVLETNPLEPTVDKFVKSTLFSLNSKDEKD